MELEVGEYIRTKRGIIGKVEHILGSYKFRTTTGHISKSQDHYYIDNSKQRGNISKLSITKHSKNIIDLIEVGDYVNGYKVELSRYNELYYAYVYCGGIGVRTTEAYATFIKDMKYEDIESIVTKEQFKEMEYRINE